MNANLELCRELYELSHWEPTKSYFYVQHDDEYDLEYCTTMPRDGGIYPAYDLGYLLRKLYEVKRNLRIEHNHGDMKWYAYYAGRSERTVEVGTMPHDTTPEDAACALAIGLFKSGQLTKEKSL